MQQQMISEQSLSKSLRVKTSMLRHKPLLQRTESDGAMMGMRGQFVVVAWIVNYTTLDRRNRNV